MLSSAAGSVRGAAVKPRPVALIVLLVMRLATVTAALALAAESAGPFGRGRLLLACCAVAGIFAVTSVVQRAGRER